MRKFNSFLAVLMLAITLSLSAGSTTFGAPIRSNHLMQALTSIEQPTENSRVYLPVIVGQRTVRRVNAPYFDVVDVMDSHFTEMSIYWFGRVTQTENYADVRIAYNNTELYVYLAVFDRRLWYDPSHVTANLTAWDSVSLNLALGGNSGSIPASSTYRFDAQLNDWEDPRTNWQAAYRGNGSGWTAAGLPFTTYDANRWDSPTEGGLNNNENNRGWAMTYVIPFSSLGLSGPPSQGSVWGMAIALHDRDDQSGTPIGDKLWPETMSANSPSTWGQLAFGLPAYTPPATSSQGTVTIRHRLNGATVDDGGVGGYTICGGGMDYWTDWGERVYYAFLENNTYVEYGDFNIQNQSDIADWPCFSKYYVTFPLGAVPSGKTIVSAKLAMYQFGNSDPVHATASLIQVLTVGDAWSETALNWNNAPLALENVSRAWVDPLPGFAGFPGVRREWDVSRAVAQAYTSGSPLRLVLYSADDDYNSGMYFVSSDTGDWNATGRPTLQVVWGNP